MQLLMRGENLMSPRKLSNEAKKDLVKIQKYMDSGCQITEAAKKVGWSRQKVHAHYARGKITTHTNVKPSTKVTDREVYKKFGKAIYHMICDGSYGKTISDVSKNIVKLVASIEDKNAYNILISRFSNWSLENCSPKSKEQSKFLKYCSDEGTSLLRKICIAKYIS